jgi:serine/threonine protein kinase
MAAGTFLGEGSYGQVTLGDGKAIKTFTKLSHLIQEYTALQYLKDCNYVVHAVGVDYEALQIHMELYDCSMRIWLYEHARVGIPHRTIMSAIFGILMGLIELHDRGLAHGDIKPGNILVKRSPLKVVLGDCGFVSVAKYAKVERTAVVYRDPDVSHDQSHDMFSLGICLLEIFGQTKFIFAENEKHNYHNLKAEVFAKITDPYLRKIIYNLLHEDKSRRPSARDLMYRLFSKNPIPWEPPITPLSHKGPNSPKIGLIINLKERLRLREFIKTNARIYKINRPKKGFGVLLYYLETHKIAPEQYTYYAGTILMIMSSIFGRSGFRLEQLLEVCGPGPNTAIYTILDQLLRDQVLINILLSPEASGGSEGSEL